MSRRVLLCITAGSYESAKKKGVIWMFQDREEFGYFDKSITLHYSVRRSRFIRLSARSVIYEAGLLTRYLGPAVCLFVGMVICLIERPTIIRATDPHVSALLGLALSRIWRVPFCVSIHTNYDLTYKLTGLSPVRWHRLERWMAGHTLPRADMVMPIRESLVEYAVANGVKAEVVRVIPHGIDMEPYRGGMSIQEGSGIWNGKAVLFVGRLSRDNCVEDAMNAFAMVQRRHSNAMLIFVGGGEEREYLGKLSIKLGIEDNVVFMGFQPRERVIEFELLADVGLCLRGGFSLIEMAMAGLPLVSYDIDWHYELVRDGETGFLLTEGFVLGVARGIGSLLDDRAMARRMGERARRLAVERHSVENTSKIKVECYEELVDG